MMQKLLQRTLDLFSLEPAPSSTTAGKAGKPAKPKAVRPSREAKPFGPANADLLDFFASPEPEPAAQAGAQSTQAPPQAPSSACSPPVQSLQEALAPASFRHPEASREALLSGVLVAYAFRRGKRRTIGFSVGAEGLAVSAPKWVPLQDIDRSVQEKGSWILKKLQETRERHRRMASAQVDWQDGALMPYLGGSLQVRLDPSQGRAALQAASSQPHSKAPDALNVLKLGLPHNASQAQIRDAAQAWLMRQAKQLFEERLNHFAPQLGVQWRRLSLSSAGTRWGSASVDGSIRLNWRLIHFKASVIDYVVVHELSHLRVMDHSPRFWDTVRTIVPDYAELRSQLKDEMIPTW